MKRQLRFVALCFALAPCATGSSQLTDTLEKTTITNDTTKLKTTTMETLRLTKASERFDEFEREKHNRTKDGLGFSEYFLVDGTYVLYYTRLLVEFYN